MVLESLGMSSAEPRVDSSGATGYLAAEGFVPELRHELGETSVELDRLLLRRGDPVPAAWAQNVWLDPARVRFGSIAEAARALRALGRNWALYSFKLHRRAALIQAELPHVACRPLRFPAAPPSAPLGSWTLLDEHTLLAAARCSSPFRHGEIELCEDHEAPPSRAYLKLWEAFTRLGRRPGPGERCLDLGASPGGWTWALQQLGAEVVAVDKAPLDPRIAALPRVHVEQVSAFALEPGRLGPIDWLLSDVVCYPKALYRMVMRWLDAGACPNLVCTIKFQGETDHDIARRFAAIPGSSLMHLHHNRHELTWAKLAP
jgi:23S rRNA (cytidine2498-2'-O)-methyltransferase